MPRDAAAGVPTSASFAEEMRVAIVLTGVRSPAHWSGSNEDDGSCDIWDLKGLLERFADGLGLGDVSVPAPADADGALPFGTERWLSDDSLCIMRDGILVGVAGEVRSASVDAPVWAAPVLAAEFRLAAADLGGAGTFRELPSFPAVARDLALVLNREVSARAVELSMREAAPGTLESVELFDVYEGEGVDEGNRSLAWRLVFRAPDRTLTDQEVEEGLGSITANLKERFDARIRSS
jgi:phenylalanyl-tRNA synthetase beta chain